MKYLQFKEAKNHFDSGEATKCCCAYGKLRWKVGIWNHRRTARDKCGGKQSFRTARARTHQGIIDKLKVMVDFQLFEYKGKRVLVFDVPLAVRFTSAGGWNCLVV